MWHQFWAEILDAMHHHQETALTSIGAIIIALIGTAFGAMLTLLVEKIKARGGIEVEMLPGGWVQYRGDGKGNLNAYSDRSKLDLIRSVPFSFTARFYNYSPDPKSIAFLGGGLVDTSYKWRSKSFGILNHFSLMVSGVNALENDAWIGGKSFVTVSFSGDIGSQNAWEFENKNLFPAFHSEALNAKYVKIDLMTFAKKPLTIWYAIPLPPTSSTVAS